MTNTFLVNAKGFTKFPYFSICVNYDLLLVVL